MILQALVAQAAAATPPLTRDQAELARIEAETRKLNAEADEARIEADKAKIEADNAKPKDPAPSVICNAFQGKFCPIVNVGGTVSLAEPNAGTGTFETEDLPVTGPEYNYSPAGGFDQLGLSIGLENRMIRWGPDWLLGLEGQFEKVPWEIDKSDRRDPLKHSQVTEIDYGLALTLGAEFLIEAGLFTSIKLRVAPLIPWLSRARYKAPVEAEGQSKGVVVTGTYPTRDASDRPGNPAVQDWSSARSATLHGADIFIGGNVGSFSEAGFLVRWRRPESFGDSVGNEDALIARGVAPEDIPEDRRNRAIGVQGPERNAAILVTFRGRFDIARLLGRAIGRK
ncbi:MAG: hypothetical protein HY542_06675 [Deltaproteobacteria bacterium]|nr:hypothetical protein [Deltaproteobacteria bacterium]